MQNDAENRPPCTFPSIFLLYRFLKDGLATEISGGNVQGGGVWFFASFSSLHHTYDLTSQLKSWNYVQCFVSITRHWVSLTLWSVAYRQKLIESCKRMYAPWSKGNSMLFYQCNVKLSPCTLKTRPLHHNCLKPCQVMTCLSCGVDSTGSLTSR